MMRRSLLAFVAALMTVTTAPAGRAAELNPWAFVDALGGQLRLVAKDTSPEQRVADFYRLFQQDFDVPGLGRFVLGRYWRMLNEPQQREFLNLFQTYVVLSYSRRLQQLADAGAAPRVIGSRTDEDGVTVFSNWAAPAAPPIRVDWRLTVANGTYRISDVVIDGLSMAANGRTEVAGVIERNGGQAQAVLAVLRQQIEAARQ